MTTLLVNIPSTKLTPSWVLSFFTCTRRHNLIMRVFSAYAWAYISRIPHLNMKLSADDNLPKYLRKTILVYKRMGTAVLST